MKRSGRKSLSQTPAPRSEQIKGSKTNPKGSASSKTSAINIKLSDSIISTLEKKRDEYNEKHNGKVNLGTLKAIMRRGMGAYSTSHRPTISGGAPNTRQAWGFARVNKFLLKKGGTKVKKAYVQDDDLMANGGKVKKVDFSKITGKIEQYPNGNSQIFIYDPKGEEIGYLEIIYDRLDNLLYMNAKTAGVSKSEFINNSEYKKLINQFKEYGLNPKDKVRYLEQLYVYDEHRGKGYASFLLDGAIDYYRDKRDEFLLGTVGADTEYQSSLNNKELIKFYKKKGFELLKGKGKFYRNKIILRLQDKYEDGGLIAPNGKKSNLTPEQYKLVRTPQFKAWFGDWENDPKNASQVVDENGEPLVVYRGGTTKDKTGNIFKYNINRFSNNRKTNRFAFYFTESKKVAQRYASQVEGEVYYDSKTKTYKEISKHDFIINEYFINIRKSLDITPKNPNYPPFDEWVKKVPIIFTDSTLGLIEKAKKRQIPEYSYLFYSYISKKNLNIDQLSELLIKDLTKKWEKEIKEEKKRYPYEISADHLIELITNENAEKIINKEYGDYDTEYLYKLFKRRDIYEWFINKKSSEEDLPNIDLFFKNLILEKKYDGGFFNEMMSYTNPPKDLVYFVFEPNQIKLADGTNTTFDANNLDIRYEDGGLIAPNGKKSNLTPEQYELVRTPQFKAWFGDWENDPENASKVVDENGEPMLVYHNSKSNFTQFRKDKIIWVTPDEEYGQKMKDLVGENTFQLFVNAKKLIDFSIYGYKYYDQKTAYKVLKNHGIDVPSILSHPTGAMFYTFIHFYQDEIKEQLKNIGYDGIKVKVHRNFDFSYAIFEPNQVKLADGSNTTFDTNNPDIRYEDGGLIAPNGKKSNLTPEQYKLVRTPQFKAWFGDWENDPENASQVVDENGEPLVVYHGTRDGRFTIFDKNKFGERTQNINSIAFFFTPSLWYAEAYSESKNNDRIKQYEEIFGQKPNAIEPRPFAEEKTCFLNIKNPKYVKSQTKDEILLAQKEFYDGIILKTSHNEIFEIGVFEPNQVKLADGSNTTFDANNPDIRYEDGGEMGQEINCHNCGWHWNTIESSKEDKYICHHCGYNNKEYYMKEGGKLKRPPSVIKIAEKHGVELSVVMNGLKQGMKVEMEHTKDEKMARTIALHHLWESPKYYEKLKKMEKSFKDGGSVFSDKYPKNQYIQLTNEDVNEFKEDIFDIINKSYAYVGGHIEFKNPEDIVNSDLKFWIGSDIDQDPEVDTIIGGKNTNYGVKITALAQDGTKEAKISVIRKLNDLLSKKGFYAETNVDLAKNLKWETDENIIKKVVGKSDIVMNDDGSYTRNIGGEPHRKVLVGYFEHIKDNKMKKGGEINPDNATIKKSAVENSGATGGLLVGNRHSEGGIKAFNKSSGSPLEMEGGEVVITRDAVSDNKKREFEGEMLTNRQILSKINQSGGGISFADGGEVPEKCACSGKTYKYGGKIMKDYDIASYINGDNKSKRKVLENYYNSITEDSSYEKGGVLNGLEDLTECGRSFLVDLKNSGNQFLDISQDKKHKIQELENHDLIYITKSNSFGCLTAFLTSKGKKFMSEIPTHLFKKGGMTDCGCGCGSYKEGGELDVENKYFKGVDYDYENQFLINKAIEELLETKDAENLTIEEKNFLTYYSGYGGLEKYGAFGKGLLYEYFTPSVIAKKMWALAYVHGFESGMVLEPSCGIGEFIKYAPEQNMVEAYEINKTSAKIASILYPEARIKTDAFEKIFIKNNFTIKDNVKGMDKYSLVIGNPPYGSMAGLYAGMGEKDYTKANNYIDYFILRGLDLLKSRGLLIYIIGVEVAAGGKPFLQQGITENKKMIAERADLVDAYRLPNGVFERTDVLTDIVVFKKK